jgi:nucleoside-diphosphate-sugar epimerase
MTTLALVTGARGWLGTALVRALVQGLPDDPRFATPQRRKVRCLVLPGTDTAALTEMGGDLEIVTGDITKPASLAPFFAGAEGATVFHCAGLIHPEGRTSALEQVNVAGTRNVVEAAEKIGARRLIHVSSNSPCGNNPATTHLFDEASPYNPYMGYGRTKMKAELVVRAAEERGRLETVIMRPPWFYGPDQPPRQSLFFRMVRDGGAPIVGDGTNRRSMGYVGNLCQGALLCESVPAARGQIYWIADERPYPMSEIIDTIERVLEKDFSVKVAHKRLKLPFFVGQIAQLVDGTLQGLGLYHQKMHVLSEMNKTIACSVEKAKRELGYKPTVALEEGMRRSIRWLYDRGERL